MADFLFDVFFLAGAISLPVLVVAVVYLAYHRDRGVRSHTEGDSDGR